MKCVKMGCLFKDSILKIYIIFSKDDIKFESCWKKYRKMRQHELHKTNCTKYVTRYKLIWDLAWQQCSTKTVEDIFASF